MIRRLLDRLEGKAWNALFCTPLIVIWCWDTWDDEGLLGHHAPQWRWEKPPDDRAMPAYSPGPVNDLFARCGFYR